MKINEINRSAALGWCPIDGHTNMLVTGSIAGSLEPDFSSGAKMDFFTLNLEGKNSTYNGSIKSYDRFNRITWGNPNQEKFPLGIVCGAMVDGTIGIWNPEKFTKETKDDDGALIKTLDKHQGSVRGISFNTIQKNLLATAGDDSKLLIWNLQNPGEPAPFEIGGKNPHSGQVISNIAWNKVFEYILATTSHSGVSVIWDLKQKKPIVPFRNPNSRVARRYSSIAWNPSLATQLCIASEDDSASVIELWDLRSAYKPIEELQGKFGHTKGILSISWNNEDSNLMLSCGKDNRVLAWNPSKGEFLGEVAQANNWCYDVQWSYKTSILSYASYDGKISINSMQDTNPLGGNRYKNFNTAPKWLKRPVGGYFGFGGKFIHFDSSKAVKMTSITTDPNFVEKAKAFESVIKSNDFQAFCEFKITTTKGNEHDTWSIIKLLFEEDEKVQKDKLLRFLGFDKDLISSSVKNQISSGFNKVEVVEKEVEKKEEVDNKQVDELIQKSLMVSDFESAVECCLLAGRMDDALVLSSCGSQKLWAETREKYFKMKKAPILKVLSLICNGDFETIIKESDLQNWKETLAILCTYSKGKFSELCSLLGERLELEKKDIQSATLCYMCSRKSGKVIKTWLDEFKENEEPLQNFMEKVLIFQQASKKIDVVNEELTNKYIEYATKLSGEGLLSISLRYLNIISKTTSNSPDLDILRYRVYHSLDNPFGDKPYLPFGKKKVEVKERVKEQPKQPEIIKPVFSNTSDLFNPSDESFEKLLSTPETTKSNKENIFNNPSQNDQKVEEKIEDKGYQPFTRPEESIQDGLGSLGIEEESKVEEEEIEQETKEGEPKLPAKFKKLYESLTSLQSELKKSNLGESKLNLISSGLNHLYEYLNSPSLNSNLVSLILSLVDSMEKKKVREANGIIKQISADHWQSSKSFIKSLKFLNQSLK